jgi:hypothetical protein
VSPETSKALSHLLLDAPKSMTVAIFTSVRTGTQFATFRFQLSAFPVSAFPLAPVQTLIPIYSGEESVIPIWQGRVFDKVELAHLLIGDFDFGGIVLGAQGAVD